MTATEPMSQARRPELLERLADFDPGWVRLSRGLHLVAAVAAAIAAGYFLSTAGAAAVAEWIGPWLERTVPAYARALAVENRQFVVPLVTAVVAAHLILLVMPSYRAQELRETRPLALLAVLYLAGLGLAAPGSWGYGALPMHLWWIVTIGFGLYLRGRGPQGARFGTSIILLTLFAVIVNPDRAMGIWLPVAAIAGVCVGYAVRFATWRPSPVAAYRTQRARFLETAGEDLSAFADMVRRGARPTDFGHPLRRRWVALSKSMELAAAESPGRSAHLAEEVAAAFRLLLAVEAIASALTEIDAADLGGRFGADRVASALTALAAHIAASETASDATKADYRDGLVRARDELIADLDLSRQAKLQLIRLLTGISRVESALDAVGGRIETVEGPAPETPPRTNAMGWRLALQGLVAASITTSLNYAFHFDHAYWATLTVALVLNGTVGQTLARTLRRALGTAAGVLVAIALNPFIGDLFVLETVLVAISLLVAVMVFDIRYELASALIGFLVVTGLHMLEGAGQGVMLARAYETFIGAGVALAVAWTVVPAFSSDQFGGKVTAFLSQCRATFAEIGRHPNPAIDHTAPLETEVRLLMAELPSLEAERWFGRTGGAGLNRLAALLEALVSYVGLYERAVAGMTRIEVGEATRATFADLDGRVDAAFAVLTGSGDALPDFDDLLPKFAAVAPLDGSIPAAEAAVLVERLYYGRRIGQTLGELQTEWARTG
ncbi:FUSC family protein [Amorphus orientalis]|uniref:Integral membrane bound transporter domain-containing protein n=1 Tax=Amorphus orientalis TaxID=649198 RepID=A0AAE3VL47_9HYPH|nr:FUSC family protein [Amorphus orientalis]MDQ0313908.1 hypothetical protein [Amorphus orientalis]